MKIPNGPRPGDEARWNPKEPENGRSATTHLFYNGLAPTVLTYSKRFVTFTLGEGINDQKV